MTFNSSKMNLDYIRTFVVLGQSKSMTHASQKLNVTTSYVSRHIHQLEEELETKLVILGPNRDLELTESGKYFFEKYEKIYNEFLLTEKKFKQNLEMDNYKIGIGVNSDLFSSYLEKKLKKFVKKYSNLNIKIYNGDNFQLSKLLNQCRIDFMIYKSSANEIIENAEIQTTFLKKSKYCFAYNPDLFFFKDISSSPVIVPFKATEERLLLDKYLESIDVKPSVLYEMENYDKILSCIIKGFGIGFVLKETLLDYPFLQAIDIDIPVNVNIAFLPEMLTPLTSEFINYFI